MIEEIKHKGTGLTIKVISTNEERMNGISIYHVKGSIVSTSCLNVNFDLSIPEPAMVDFKITYKKFT
tara:strand:- start:454 stop:654 length:201 start_codon:yes stop_codon:yes gene_type:complete